MIDAETEGTKGEGNPPIEYRGSDQTPPCFLNRWSLGAARSGLSLRLGQQLGSKGCQKCQQFTTGAIFTGFHLPAACSFKVSQ